MGNNDSVLKVKQYGTIKIKLKQLLEKHNMKRNKFARAINSRFEVVDKWYKGTVTHIDTDVLARMCYVLNCEISDLIEYVKETEIEQ